ncbi:MAG: hypothetical protein AAF721_11880 [Myxococcota bacterium]
MPKTLFALGLVSLTVAACDGHESASGDGFGYRGIDFVVVQFGHETDKRVHEHDSGDYHGIRVYDAGSGATTTAPRDLVVRLRVEGAAAAGSDYEMLATTPGATKNSRLLCAATSHPLVPAVPVSTDPFEYEVTIPRGCEGSAAWFSMIDDGDPERTEAIELTLVDVSAGGEIGAEDVRRWFILDDD